MECAASDTKARLVWIGEEQRDEYSDLYVVDAGMRARACGT